MKIKHLPLACAVLLAALTGCSKSNTGGGDNPATEKSIFLKIDQTVIGKATTDPVADNTPVQIESGYLVFTHNDIIKRMVEVVPGYGSPGVVGLEDLKKGVTITSVPIECDVVAFFGNSDPVSGNPLGQNITTAFSSAPMTIQDQTDSDFGITKASVFGQGVIYESALVTNPIGNADYWSEFTAAPLIARLEMNKITAENPGAGVNDIKSYKLEGIFINNIYYQLYANGSYPAGSFKNHGNTASTYVRGTTAYPTTDEEYTYDVQGYTLGLDQNNLTVAADPSGKTWAYNIFAVGGNIPHIVLHLTDVKVEDGGVEKNWNHAGDDDGVAYLTVNGYVDIDNGNANIGSFEGGKIYRIDELKFNSGDLGETPEPNERKEVDVRVKLMPWKVVNTGGVIN